MPAPAAAHTALDTVWDAAGSSAEQQASLQTVIGGGLFKFRLIRRVNLIVLFMKRKRTAT